MRLLYRDSRGIRSRVPLVNVARCILCCIATFSLYLREVDAQTLLVIDDFVDGPFSLTHNGTLAATVSSAALVPSSGIPSLKRSFEMRNFDLSGSSITADLNTTLPGTLNLGSSVNANGLDQLFYGDSSSPTGLYFDTSPYAGSTKGIILTATSAITTSVDLEASINAISFIPSTGSGGGFNQNNFTQQRKWFAGNGVFFPWSDFILTEQQISNGPFNPVSNGPAFDPLDTSPGGLFSRIGNLIFNFKVDNGDDFEIDSITIGVPSAGFCQTCAPINPTVIPGPSGGNIFRFGNVHRQRWNDPPMAYGYDYEMQSDSLFTNIALPDFVVDAQIYVGDTLLGTFQGEQLIRFADFASVLGSLLVVDLVNGGIGVKSFRIQGIEVDSTDPLAFPLYVDSDTELLSFDQIPILVPEPPARFLGACMLLIAIGAFRGRRTVTKNGRPRAPLSDRRLAPPRQAEAIVPSRVA